MDQVSIMLTMDSNLSVSFGVWKVNKYEWKIKYYVETPSFPATTVSVYFLQYLLSLSSQTF